MYVFIEKRTAQIHREYEAKEALAIAERSALEAELRALQLMYENAESALADYRKSLTDTASKLRELRALVPESHLEAALAALGTGRQEEADTLLAEAEQKAIAQTKRSFQQAGQAAFQRGVIAENSIQFREALNHYKRAAAHDPEQAAYANAAGAIAIKLGNFIEAEAHFTTALNLLEAQPVALAETLSNLAGARLEQGEIGSAIQFLEQARKIQEKNCAPALQQAKTLNSLGGCYQAAGFVDFALDCFEKSLYIRNAETGPESLEAAATLNNLGGLCFKIRQLSRAGECHKAALKIRARLLPARHPDMVNSLNNLAAVHLATGAVQKAKALLEQALEMQQAIYGASHHSIAITLNNLGQVDQRNGDVSAALARFRKALEMAIATLGEAHPSTWQIEQNLLAVDTPHVSTRDKRGWH